MARCPGLAQEAVTLVFGPQEQQSPPTCTGCREQRSAARRKPGREAAAQHTHPRPPRAWGWPHAGIPVPTLPNGRELPPRVSAGFPHPAPGQKPVHPVSLSTRPQSRAHGLAPAANAPSPARQGPGRRNRTCRAPPRRAPVRPGNRGAGETPARRAKSPHPCGEPQLSHLRPESAGTRSGGPTGGTPGGTPPTRASWEGARPQRSALRDPDLPATSRLIAPPPQPLQAGARAPLGV